MNYWQSVQTAAGMSGYYHWVLLGTILAAMILRAAVPSAAGRCRAAAVLALLSWPGILICGLLLHYGTPASHPGYRWLHFASQWALAIAIVSLAGVMVFRVLLEAVHLEAPPILRDAIVGVAYILVALSLLSHHDVNLTGIVATSAVVTAVIGFSLQDTLGNIMGGVALQMERSISVGDWIRVGEIEGLVHEIRWRQTSIETRGWDTIVIPNSVLMKTQVTVLGRRSGRPRLHRTLVPFNVDYRHSPFDVIEIVQQSLRADAIPGVGSDPPMMCILKEFLDSSCSYALAYWTADIARIEQTNSILRIRIFVALQRSAIAMSIPAQSIFMTVEGQEREKSRFQAELNRRIAALKQVQIFQSLTDDERRDIADRLTLAPFHRGELITRQGDHADHLYILFRGDAEVRYDPGSGTGVQITRLKAGEVFGEMGLMTGEPRAATVIAATDVICYRLDRIAFADALQRRPALAEEIAALLSKRRAELDAVKAGMASAAKSDGEGETRHDLLRRIRDFFSLG